MKSQNETMIPSKRKIIKALIWVLVGFSASIISGLGTKMIGLIWPEKSDVILEYTEQWKAFGRIYAVVANKEDMVSSKPGSREIGQVVGKLPFYEQYILIENKGSAEAKNVVIDLSDISRSRSISLIPDTLQYNIERYDTTPMPLSPQNHIRHRAIVKISSLPPKLPLKITISEEIENPKFYMSRVRSIIADNSSPGTLTNRVVDYRKIQKGLTRDAVEVFSMKIPLNKQAWENSYANIVVEFSPGHQKALKYPGRE